MAPSAKTEEENEYEAQRAANIAKNQALLRELQLNAAKAGLGISSKSTAKSALSRASTDRSHNKKAAAAVKKEKAEIAPRRTSSRLAGLQADSEVAKRKAEEEHAAIQEAARIKRQRISADLDLGDVVVTGKEWDRSRNFLVEATRGKKYERTFMEKDVRETGDRGLKELRQRMSGLQLYEGFEPNRIKITPERIMGNLGIFDASQSIQVVESEDDEEALSPPEPAITAFKLHTRTISSFVFPGSTGTTLLSTSYDSSIRSLDLSASKSIELYAPPTTSTDDDEPITGIDVPFDSPSTIYFSTMNGSLGRHDTRAPTDNTGGTELYQLSEKKIGGFSLHPQHPHLVATASLDRMLKIWDLRKVSGRGEGRVPALLGEHESRLSVSHAAWNMAGQVATASYDDTIKVHDFGAQDCGAWKVARDVVEANMLPAVTIPHNNQTGRWVTISRFVAHSLRPQWQLQPPDGIHKLCIGNMNRFVDVYSAKGEQLAQLGGDGVTAVPAVAQFHPSVDWIAGGTASGKLCLWM
ncbi:MAG: hypothetical protein M1816_003295 [Peltula sp. TS41687]|nr:MAG: hypothetical protein M1816_003295 [Peltula sp. TS41687]